MSTGKAVSIALVIVALSVLGYTLLHEDDRAAAPNSAIELDQTVEVRTDDSVSVRADDAPLLEELPEELNNPVFSQVSQSTAARLQPWVDDVFLGKFDVPEAIIRTGFVSADNLYLQEELTRSLQDAQQLGEVSDASINLALFDDRTYRVVTNKYRLGSTGYKNFGAAIVGSTGLGREYFQFEIAPDGRVMGRAVSANGVYRFVPTPEPGVLLVIEIDESVVSKSITIDKSGE